MRPREILWFEIIFLLSVGMSWIESVVSDPGRYISLQPRGIVPDLLTNGLLVALALFTSRGRNRVTKWILAVLTVAIWWATADDLFSGGQIRMRDLGMIGLVTCSVVLLFTAPARRWFKREPAARQLQRTFE